MLGVLVWLILDHFHPLPAFALLMTVFTDHIQLANAVLKDRQQTDNQASDWTAYLTEMGR